MAAPDQPHAGAFPLQVGMLFALPTLRMLMDAPLGSYIDMVCFAWCMVLVAIAVVLFFSASYSEHEHQAQVFERDEVPQKVLIVEESSKRLTESFGAVLNKMTTHYHTVLKKQLSEKFAASHHHLPAASSADAAICAAAGLYEVVGDDADDSDGDVSDTAADNAQV
jgi:hypothetical protein